VQPDGRLERRTVVKTLVALAALTAAICLPSGGAWATRTDHLEGARRCEPAPRPVSADRLPGDVAAFADGAPIAGEGALWLLVNRRAFTPVFDVEGDQWALRKVVWYRRRGGVIAIIERRAGATQRVADELPADGYGETGFRPSSLRFPRGGCWHVTARLHDSEVRFDVRVPTGLRAVCDDITQQVRELRAIPIAENLARAGDLEAMLAERGCDAAG